MRIHTCVSAYYEWEPCDTSDFTDPNAPVVDGDVLSLSEIKQNHAGQWLRKVLVERETHNDTNLPDSEIDDCMAHFERVGAKKSRKQTVAWYLAEKVYPHHLHPENITEITIEDDKETEAYLKMFFEVPAATENNHA